MFDDFSILGMGMVDSITELLDKNNRIDSLNRNVTRIGVKPPFLASLHQLDALEGCLHVIHIFIRMGLVGEFNPRFLKLASLLGSF